MLSTDHKAPRYTVFSTPRSLAPLTPKYLPQHSILQHLQPMFQPFTDAPWYVPNAVIKHDLQVPTVRQEVRTCSVIYHARLEGHPNDLATSLLQQPTHNRRLKRYYPADLVTHF